VRLYRRQGIVLVGKFRSTDEPVAALRSKGLGEPEVEELLS
jgi:hypothetical protein